MRKSSILVLRHWASSSLPPRLLQCASLNLSFWFPWQCARSLMRWFNNSAVKGTLLGICRPVMGKGFNNARCKKMALIGNRNIQHLRMSCELSPPPPSTVLIQTILPEKVRPPSSFRASCTFCITGDGVTRRGERSAHVGLKPLSDIQCVSRIKSRSRGSSRSDAFTTTETYNGSFRRGRRGRQDVTCNFLFWKKNMLLFTPAKALEIDVE